MVCYSAEGRQKMQRDYTKICRVCMAEGSRDIFPNRNVTDSTLATISGTTDGAPHQTRTPQVMSSSPLDRLLEKLRYVTMMKIEETDDLPRVLCDLCIVQLNVAYNFKRQAVENDTKLRQYFIENGISSNQYTAPVGTSGGLSVRTSITGTPLPPYQHSGSHNLPIIPLVVKSETIESDGFLNVKETNLEQLDVSNISKAVNPQSNFDRISGGSSMVSITPSSEMNFPQKSQATRLPNQGENQVNKELAQIAETQTSLKAVSNSSENTTEKTQIKKHSSTSQDKSVPEKKKLKFQSSVDLDKEERSLPRTREVKRLTIYSNFQPSNAPRQARQVKLPVPGRTNRISSIQNQESSYLDQKYIKTSEKKFRPKDDPSSVKKTKTSLRNSSIDCRTYRKMVMNTFTSKKTSEMNILKTVRNTRRKKSPEKLYGPKLSPSNYSSEQFLKATSTI